MKIHSFLICTLTKSTPAGDIVSFCCGLADTKLTLTVMLCLHSTLLLDWNQEVMPGLSFVRSQRLHQVASYLHSLALIAVELLEEIRQWDPFPCSLRGGLLLCSKQGQHLMIYSYERDFFIFCSLITMLLTCTHRPGSLSASPQHLSCCHQVILVLRQKTDTRKEKGKPYLIPLYI